MSVQFNHTIIASKDARESAEFFAELLGLEVGAPWGPFIPVTLDNGVTLDFAGSPDGNTPTQHYAFLVSEDVFDAAYKKIADRRIEHWADPRRQNPGEYNTNDGGKGVYFLDPSGHAMEILTVPYGGWPKK